MRHTLCSSRKKIKESCQASCLLQTTLGRLRQLTVNPHYFYWIIKEGTKQEEIPEESRICQHCHKIGHNIDSYWILNPNLRNRSRFGANSNNTNTSSNNTQASNVNSDYDTGSVQDSIQGKSSSSSQVFTKEQYDQIMKLLSTSETSSNSSSWNIHVNMPGILNLQNGATNHMSSRIEWLCNLKSIPISKVKLPNGWTSRITHKGDHLMRKAIILKIIFYVPNLRIIFYPF